MMYFSAPPRCILCTIFIISFCEKRLFTFYTAPLYSMLTGKEKSQRERNSKQYNDLGTGKEKNIMKITTEVTPNNYDFFWAGARDTVNNMTLEQIEEVFYMLEEIYPEGMTDTELNDFFWFEEDTIADWLGFDSFEDLIKANEDK